MRKSILLLLLLPFVAQAEHHRMHTIDRIDQTLEQLDRQLLNIEYMQDKCITQEMQDGSHWNTLRFYNNSNRSVLLHIKSELGRALPDFEALRRLANMPNEANTTDSPPSMMWKAQSQMSAVYAIQNVLPQWYYGTPDICVRKFYNIGLRQIKVIRLLPQVIWHINDTVREETYQDPVFICSGPGNHCE